MERAGEIPARSAEGDRRTVWEYFAGADVWRLAVKLCAQIMLNILAASGFRHFIDTWAMHTPIIGLAFRRYQDQGSFGVGVSERLLHAYAIGQTGTGKTTLLQNLAWQDAKFGNGFCLIDPDLCP
jgi:hypothetical protein